MVQPHICHITILADIGVCGDNMRCSLLLFYIAILQCLAVIVQSHAREHYTVSAPGRTKCHQCVPALRACHECAGGVYVSAAPREKRISRK